MEYKVETIDIRELLRLINKDQRTKGSGYGSLIRFYFRSKMRWNLDGSWLRVNGSWSNYG